jgi:hypothetical protein
MIDIPEKSDEELVKEAGEVIPGGAPSGMAFQAQAELTRRLSKNIIDLNKSSERYSKAIIIVAYAQLVLAFFSVMVFILGSSLKEEGWILLLVIGAVIGYILSLLKKIS